MKEFSDLPRCRFMWVAHDDPNSKAPQKGGASWNSIAGN
jgi:hypothetical protein